MSSMIYAWLGFKYASEYTKKLEKKFIKKLDFFPSLVNKVMQFMLPNVHNVIGNRSHVTWTEKFRYLKRGIKILNFEETNFEINFWRMHYEIWTGLEYWKSKTFHTQYFLKL